MHIRRDKLEFGIPLEGDVYFVCHAGLVVKNLEINQETPGCQACHNDIVGCNAVAVAFGLEGLLEDEIAISMEGNHVVLVPRACPDWEVASVIRVQPAEGVHRDEDLVGWPILGTRGSGRQCWRCQGCGQFRLGRPNILVLLGKMT